MPILGAIRERLASRRERKRAAYAESRGYLSDEELGTVKRRFRRTEMRSTGGMREGTGISPTGTPVDFTADEKPPKY